MSDTDTDDIERCPICGLELAEGEHYYADPPADYSYHTDNEGIARTWEHRDGLDVTPSTPPYLDSTIGSKRSVDTDTDQ
jgi:hypothetical protein